MAWANLLKTGNSRIIKRLPLLLECVLCSNKFTTEDADKKVYFPETLVCRECYIQGKKVNPQVWCFAKLQTPKMPGYSPDNLSCKLLCPDRKVCKQFIKTTKEK